jgi:hypothetical protein
MWQVLTDYVKPLALRLVHTCAAGTDDNSIKLSDWQFHYTPHTTTNP